MSARCQPLSHADSPPCLQSAAVLCSAHAAQAGTPQHSVSRSQHSSKMGNLPGCCVSLVSIVPACCMHMLTAAAAPWTCRNCADVVINGGSGTTPPPGGVCGKCNLPAWQGGCKCDSNCDCRGELVLQLITAWGMCCHSKQCWCVKLLVTFHPPICFLACRLCCTVACPNQI